MHLAVVGCDEQQRPLALGSGQAGNELLPEEMADGAELGLPLGAARPVTMPNRVDSAPVGGDERPPSGGLVKDVA